MVCKILIVDDEYSGRELIKDLLSEYAAGHVVFEAACADEAVQMITHKNIDILLCDVRMPEKDGFDLLEEFPDRNFDVLFITAYSDYAIKAIKEGAKDYLLKPIIKSEFKEAINKVLNERLRRSLIQNDVSGYNGRKLEINHKEGRSYIALSDIVYLEANNSYTFIVCADNSRVVLSKPIYRLETILPLPFFFRIHKSYIINLHYFKEYIRKREVAVIDNNTELPISRYKLKQFLEAVSSFSGEIRI